MFNKQCSENVRRVSTWERLASFVTGVVLISAVIWISLVVQNPNELQIMVFRVTLALAGGALTALVPSWFEFQHRGKIRAVGGVAAIIVILHFTSYLSEHADINGDCNVVGSNSSISINCNNN